MFYSDSELVKRIADYIRELGDGTLADSVELFARNNPELRRDNGHRWSLVEYDTEAVKDALSKHMKRKPTKKDVQFAMGFLESCEDNMGDEDDGMFWGELLEAMEYGKRHG